MNAYATEKVLATENLKNLISEKDKAGVQAFFGPSSPAEMSRAISTLDKSTKLSLFELLGPETSAEIITNIFDMGQTRIMEEMPTDKASPILQEMTPDTQTHVIRTLGEKKAESILQEVKPARAEEIRQLALYPENTAGGLMITEFLSYPGHLLVKDVLDDLRAYGESYSDYDIQYAYVVSEEGRLVGVLRLRDLLMSQRNKPLTEIMVKDPLKVEVDTTLQGLRNFFQQHAFLGVPVADKEGNLVGIVRSATVREAANKRTNQLFLKFAGIVGGEEFRNMPLFRRSSRRLSWLSMNIILNIVAASIIAIYQDTLEKAIVLAVFLPIISDMSGCSGNQAVAVSIRELTLGLVRPREIWRVLSKESSIGIINGVVLGCLLGGAALLWKGNPYLGLVVGASLAANTLVAVSFGGLVPLILRAIKTDPALASGPLLTTITDMCGFFFVLSFASFLLPKLTS
jgi:magnesium transporter